MSHLRVLLVEDSQEDAILLLRELSRGGYEPAHRQVQTAEEFQAALESGEWDLIIADWHLPNFSAPAALAILKQSGIDLPFLILSGVVREDEAIAAMKAGAHDYIQKGNPGRLLPAIERELREAELRRRSRRLEHALQQSQKMELIGRFAGQVAAEFKKALVTITLSAAALGERLPRTGPAREDLDNIEEAAQRAGLITLQLLSLGESQAVRTKLLDLNSIVEDNHDVLKHIVGPGINLSTALNAALDAIQADRSQIEQVLLNLVVNARDATPAGGTISIETANAELGPSDLFEFLQAEPGEYVRLTVRDTGSGIPREVRPHIFEPFFSTKPGRGTGMGLAFVYNIVKQSGGAIRVQTEPGKGTAISIFLPRAKPAVPVKAEGARPEPARKRTVLVVDHDEDASAPLRAAIADAGDVVLYARDGRTAKLVARSFGGAINLLLVSVVLPDMSGADLAADLVQFQPNMAVVYSNACDGAGLLPGRSGIFVDAGGDPRETVAKLYEILETPVAGA